LEPVGWRRILLLIFILLLILFLLLIFLLLLLSVLGQQLPQLLQSAEEQRANSRAASSHLLGDLGPRFCAIILMRGVSDGNTIEGTCYTASSGNIGRCRRR
jgi:predicted PurR-regulated permease PerM